MASRFFTFLSLTIGLSVAGGLQAQSMDQGLRIPISDILDLPDGDLEQSSVGVSGSVDEKELYISGQGDRELDFTFESELLIVDFCDLDVEKVSDFAVLELDGERFVLAVESVGADNEGCFRLFISFNEKILSRIEAVYSSGSDFMTLVLEVFVLQEWSELSLQLPLGIFTGNGVGIEDRPSESSQASPLIESGQNSSASASCHLKNSASKQNAFFIFMLLVLMLFARRLSRESKSV